jgi:hypothetical protein
MKVVCVYMYVYARAQSKSEREEIEKDIREKEDPPCGKDEGVGR